MTERDAFIVKLLKDSAKMYGGIFIVLVLASVGAFIAAIAALVMGKPGGALGFAGATAGLLASALTNRSKGKEYTEAVEEIGDEPDNLDAYHDYSPLTIRLIAEVKHPAKSFFQMAVAYGFSALICLGAGVLVVVLVAPEEPLLATLSSVLFAFGIWLAVLTFNSITSWKTAKRLEETLGGR